MNKTTESIKKPNLFKRFIISDLWCLSLLLAALIWNLYLIYQNDPFLRALTTALRNYNMDKYVYSLIWGFLMGAAVFCNVEKLNHHLGFVGTRFAKVAKAFLYVSLFFLFTNCAILEHDIDLVHSFSSMLFAFIAMASLVMSLIYASVRSIKYVIVTLILLVLFYLSALFLLELSPKGIWETFPITAAFITLFLVNFTDTFKLKKAGAQKSGKLFHKANRV